MHYVVHHWSIHQEAALYAPMPFLPLLCLVFFTALCVVGHAFQVWTLLQVRNSCSIDNNCMCVTTQHGQSINKHGGIFHNGKSYDFRKKLEVAIAYKAAEEAHIGGRPNIRALIKKCQVSWYFMNKIENKLKNHGRHRGPRRDSVGM